MPRNCECGLNKANAESSAGRFAWAASFLDPDPQTVPLNSEVSSLEHLVEMIPAEECTRRNRRQLLAERSAEVSGKRPGVVEGTERAAVEDC